MGMNPCTSPSSLKGNRDIGSPMSPLCSFVFRWTHPQGDTGWLHGFLNDVEQVLTQLAQVYLTA